MTRDIPRKHRALFILLAVSYALRLYLVHAGGRHFYPDEMRYERAMVVGNALLHGQLGLALDTFVSYGDHTGFVFFGFVPCLFQFLLRLIAGIHPPDSDWVGAAFCALGSIACILLTYLLALRSGGDEEESFFAAFLMACTSSIFYFSRFLLPYDFGLALILLGLYVGWMENPGFRRSVAAGFLVGFGVFTYNGYWAAGTAAICIFVLRNQPDFRNVLRRSLGAGLGATLPVLAFEALARIRHQPSFVEAMVKFSATLSWYGQGVYYEGWRIMWPYFWHGEHGILILWVAGLILVAAKTLRRQPTTSREGYWLICFLLIWVMLSIVSTGLHKSVIYGRTTREMIPFLCLIVAARMRDLLPRKEAVKFACFGLIATQALYNFTPIMTQEFGSDLGKKLWAKYGPLTEAFTIARARNEKPEPPASRYVLMNADIIWPTLYPLPAPKGKVLFRTRNPQEYLPTQYDGQKPWEREIYCVPRIFPSLSLTHKALGRIKNPFNRYIFPTFYNISLPVCVGRASE